MAVPLKKGWVWGWKVAVLAPWEDQLALEQPRLCRESHQNLILAPPLLSPAPGSAFQTPKCPQSWPCKGREEFEEPGVRPHFAAIAHFQP